MIYVPSPPVTDFPAVQREFYRIAQAMGGSTDGLGSGFVVLSDYVDDANAASVGISRAIEAAEADGKTILVIGGTYVVESPITSPAGVNWLFSGGIIDVQAEFVINGGVTATTFHSQCFVIESAPDRDSSLLRIRDADDANTISPYVEKMSPLWFNGGDIGEQINKCWQVGGTKTLCSVPTGFHTLTTTVDMDYAKWGSHLTLEGVSFIATTLQIPAHYPLCGVDASTSDECEIRNIRVTEGTGTRVSICIASGGTSLKVNQCWAGNAKYGLYQNKGSGTKYEGNFVENCTYNVYIASNDDQRADIPTAPPPTAGITAVTLQGGLLHNAAGFNLYIARQSTNIINTLQIIGVTLQAGSQQNIHISDNHTAHGIKGLVVTGCGIRESKGSGGDDCGVYVNNASALFSGNVIIDNEDAAFGLEGDAIVVSVGNTFGNATGEEQVNDWKIISGAGKYMEIGGYELADDTIRNRVSTADFVSGTLNSSSENVVQSRSIKTREQHEWKITGEAANGDLDQLFHVWVYCDHAGDITYHEHRYLESGSQTLTVTDNLDQTYTISIANNNSNDKVYFGSLVDVIRRAS